MKKIILLSALILLSACGTTGPVNLSKLDEAIPANTARIIVTRDNSLLYLAAAVDVRSNGTKIRYSEENLCELEPRRGTGKGITGYSERM